MPECEGPSGGRGTNPALAALEELHGEVERRATALAARHEARIRCRLGCHDCCADGLTVFDIEAERIRRRHPALLSEGRPHLPGKCALLDERGGCRVYDVRPYVCRTQGLPLRWLEPDDAGGALEYRDICPLNDEGGPALETLPAKDCWEIGPSETRLATLQAAWQGEPVGAGLRRVALRALFEG